MDYVTDLPKSSKYNFTAILILVCNLTKMAHYLPWHKEITSKETFARFIDNCYKLHGAPKVIVFDRDPRLVGTIWQSFMMKLNTKLNISKARHPQTDGLTERDNETMQMFLCCYTPKSGFDWVSQLLMIKFYYNCSIDEASMHSPFEVSYGFQPTTFANRLLPLAGAPAPIVERLTELASVRDVVRELLTLSKQRMATRSFRPAPIFAVGDFVFLFSKGLHIYSQKCNHLRDQRLGPFQVIEKVGLKSYRLKLPP